MNKIICVLPTGEWAEINSENLPAFITVTTEQLTDLASGEIDVLDLTVA